MYTVLVLYSHVQDLHTMKLNPEFRLVHLEKVDHVRLQAGS